MLYNPVCEYGCGNEARFQFRNKRWCCCENHNSCPAIRKFFSDNRKGENNSFFGKHHLEESKNKMGNHLTNRKGSNSPNYGKNFQRSNETKKRISDSKIGDKHPMFGKTLSEEHKNKISNSLKGRISPKRGRPVSEETRIQMSISHIGKKESDDTKNKKRMSLKKAWKNNINRRNNVRERMKNGGSAHANSFIQNPSKPQIKLFELVKELYESTILNYNMYPEYKLNYSVDIVIPEYKICIEYDGWWFHKDKLEKDIERQRKIEEKGFKFIRYSGIKSKDIIPAIEILKDDILSILYKEI